MVRSPFHEELLACDQLIKVAIMRHGSIWISSTDATLGNRKVNTVDTFPSKNVLRHITTGNRKDAAVKSRATIRSPRICTTTRTRCSIFCETCTSPRSDLMTFRSSMQQQARSLEACRSFHDVCLIHFESSLCTSTITNIMSSHQKKKNGVVLGDASAALAIVARRGLAN